MKMEDFKEGQKRVLRCHKCNEFHSWSVGAMQYGTRVMLHLDMDKSPCGNYGMLMYPERLEEKV